MDKKPEFKLSAEHFKMIYDIRVLTEKYEAPFGVTEKGQVGTLPDIMFLILLEEELFDLKERLGLPIINCPNCKCSIDNVAELVKIKDKDHVRELLQQARENIEYFKKNGKMKNEEEEEKNK